MRDHIQRYSERLAYAMALGGMRDVPALGEALREAWRRGNRVYFCGNGGSAANAIHLANDFLSAPGMRGRGLCVEALSANPAVMTSLANDLGYDHVYAEQIKVKGRPGDVLVVFSGSGNSPNVVRALETANAVGMTTVAVLGFSGGLCKGIARHAIHFEIDDMQIAEDLQLIVGHMCMQWLAASPVTDESLR